MTCFNAMQHAGAGGAKGGLKKAVRRPVQSNRINSPTTFQKQTQQRILFADSELLLPAATSESQLIGSIDVDWEIGCQLLEGHKPLRGRFESLLSD